jgi:hypothetical protein
MRDETFQRLIKEPTPLNVRAKKPRLYSNFLILADEFHIRYYTISGDKKGRRVLEPGAHPGG